MAWAPSAKSTKQGPAKKKSFNTLARDTIQTVMPSDGTDSLQAGHSQQWSAHGFNNFLADHFSIG